MEIIKWENYVFKKYNAVKIVYFLDLKKYLTDPEHYAFNFTPEEITETEITNEEFYAAYVFDEDQIAGRKVVSEIDSCWNTIVIFIASKDKISISGWSAHDSNGLFEDEFNKFFRDVDPMQDSEHFNE